MDYHKIHCSIMGHTRPKSFRFAYLYSDGKPQTMRCSKCKVKVDGGFTDEGETHKGCGGIFKTHLDGKDWYCQDCGYNQELFIKTRKMKG